MTEGANQAWNRFVELWHINRRTHGSHQHKLQLAEVLKYVGATRFKFGALPGDLKRRIKTDILRGYSVTRHGNLRAWAVLVAENAPHPIKLGYVCRQYMELYVDVKPWSKERTDFTEAIQALCAVTGKVQSNHMKFDSDADYLLVKGSGGWKGDGPRFKEVKLFVDMEMKKTLAKRQRVVEWFESGPEVTILFDAK